MRFPRHPRSWISPLQLRIWVIVIFPIALFYLGLVNIDQYRQTVINSELDALYRQGDTLARSIGITDAEHSTLARRQLSERTMQRANQLINSIPEARIRLFQPDGERISDSATALPLTAPQTSLSQRQTGGSGGFNIGDIFANIADFFTPRSDYPIYLEKVHQTASDFPAVLSALGGERQNLIMRDKRGKLILGVAVPVRHLRVVRAAVLITASGEAVEADIRAVQYSFFIIFLGILIITIALGYYLARSITQPIKRLADAADAVRLSKNNISLPKMMHRNDEIGDLAQNLSAMTDELQMRMQATAAFAADVAHEIKNPLTSLRSAVETITRLNDESQKRKLMDIILADVGRLDRLISDISQASRLDADMNPADFTAIDLAALIRNFAEARQHNIDDKNLTLKTATPTNPIMVGGLVDRLVQVLDNLYANAVSFSPKNGVISLTVTAQKNWAIVTMADEGVGIPPAKLDAIFSRFYTERPSGEVFGQHSGLGLSISRKIIEIHGGTLTAHNSDNISDSISDGISDGITANNNKNSPENKLGVKKSPENKLGAEKLPPKKSRAEKSPEKKSGAMLRIQLPLVSAQPIS